MSYTGKRQEYTFFHFKSSYAQTCSQETISPPTLWYNGLMIGIKVLISFVGGFLVAQVAKLVAALVKRRGKLTGKEALEWLMRSGGMPSGHAASFLATTTYLGCACGFDSAIFALALCMSLIIIYDAVNVRYAVGEHGKILTEAAEKRGGKKPSRIVEGHTVPQVIVGGVLGIAIGCLIYFC